MTRYACVVNPLDYLKVADDPTPLGNVSVEVNIGYTSAREEIFLPPAEARRLAKAIKKAAVRAEGGA